jgi:tripartite-type tricarboxylate transporter receptor subunit TctC
LGQRLAQKLGVPVLIDNKPGGSLIIGAQAVARAPADGYTYLLGSVTSLAINVSAFKKLPYDPVKDFAPVSLAFYTPLYLVTSPNLPANSVKELIALAKRKPDELSFASLGYGTSLHLAGEYFKSLTGIELTHVPYKGPTTAFPDISEGRVDILFDGGALLPHARAGKLKLMAVTSPKRMSSTPEVPTMAEAGVPGYDLVIWFGFVAPVGVAKPIVDRMSAEIAAINREPTFQQQFAGMGLEPTSNTPEVFRQLIADDTKKWGRLLKDSGVQPQ